MSYAPTPRPKPRVRTFASANVGLTDDHGHVDHDSVTISKGGSVSWFSNKHGAAKILFDKGDGTPFASPEFDVPVDGSVSTGPAIRSGKFKYSVHGDHGNNDPVVVVDP